MRIIQVEQRSPEWHEARLEKISGTRLCAAIGTEKKQNDLINELIAERLTGAAKEVYVTKQMEKGIEAEDYAADEYEQLTGEATEKVGICVSDEFDWLINSPDRLIPKKGKYCKAAEFKCPDPNTLVGYIRDNVVPKDYLPQVMNYFLVNDDLEELDFVGYSNLIQASQFRMWILKVRREDLPLEESKKKLLEFYAKWQGELRRLNLTI